MKSLNIISMFLGGAVAALVLVVLRHASAPPPASAPEHSGAGTAPHAVARSDGDGGREPRATGPERRPGGEPRTGHEPAEPSAGGEGARQEAVSELRRMAQGYRSRVFLRAIRQRGHYCDGIVGMQLGDGDLEAWRVDCRGAEAYLLTVDSAGGLVIETLYYGDPAARGPTLLEPESRRFRLPETDRP